VFDRDNGTCIIGAMLESGKCPETFDAFAYSHTCLDPAHFISRANGGLGIPQNIGLLCRRCHTTYDNGTIEQKREIGEIFAAHLKSLYPEWDKLQLIYRK